MTLPTIHILATGGTIGFKGYERLAAVTYGEKGAPVLIDELLARIPELAEIAQISSEQPFIEGHEGRSIGPPEWVWLAQRCNQILAGDDPPDGIVVTHGTYVMEETAYFLDLTVNSDRPVVLTAAQRPSSALGSDAEINLVNAVLAAAAPESKGKGVLAVLNHQINAARDVTKTSTYRAEAFESRDLGFLGYVDSDGQVVYYRTPTKRHTGQSEFAVSPSTQLPWVDIVHTFAGDDGRAVDALVDRGARGLIITAGGPNPALVAAISRAIAAGVTVVRSSRLGSGRVMTTPRSVEAGIISADNLSPRKARILLMLALAEELDREQVQRVFNEY